jgi:hypothetical protein
MADSLDRAHYVEAREVGGVVYIACWNGAHTVNSYAASGAVGPTSLETLDSHSVGDFATDTATLDEVRDCMATLWDDLDADD